MNKRNNMCDFQSVEFQIKDKKKLKKSNKSNKLWRKICKSSRTAKIIYIASMMLWKEALEVFECFDSVASFMRPYSSHASNICCSIVQIGVTKHSFRIF